MRAVNIFCAGAMAAFAFVAMVRGDAIGVAIDLAFVAANIGVAYLQTGARDMRDDERRERAERA